MSESAVAVASYDMAEEAHLARIRLAQHGILAYVSDDKHVGPMIVLPGLGGWAVRVSATDRDRALGILEGPVDAETALDDDPAADPEAVPASDGEGEAEAPASDASPPPSEPSRPPCPACGSTEVTTERFLPRWEWLVVLATFCVAKFAFLFRPKTRWMCVDCGRRWQVDPP